MAVGWWNKASVFPLFQGKHPNLRDFPYTVTLQLTSPQADGVTYVSQKERAHTPGLVVHYMLLKETPAGRLVMPIVYPTYTPMVSDGVEWCWRLCV